jgi:hypothetical protein
MLFSIFNRAIAEFCYREQENCESSGPFSKPEMTTMPFQQQSAAIDDSGYRGALEALLPDSG